MKKICARFLRGVLVLLSLLPLKFHYFLADIFAWMIKKMLKYRTDVIYVNLARSFPQLKYHGVFCTNFR